ncbi:MAG: hypothetical protein IJH65_08880 [Methanobrevibacter sp.]|nr:hypothetical protein [Methanobrevibacter sp.]
MSNFDMFFYRLQSENRFHLSNVQFYDDSGNNSLKKTFNEIRDYMDNTSIPIGDYRIVFGMRAHRKEKPRWEETLLYRMIKIHYHLLESRLYIQSKDASDKSVSIIMLYDSDFLLGSSNLGTYIINDDIKILLDRINLNPETIKDNNSIDAIKEHVSTNAEIDAITQSFIIGYINAFCLPSSIKSLGEECDIEHMLSQEGSEEATGYFPGFKEGKLDLALFAEYTENCIGYFSVFQKEIDANRLDENLLALLGIVDYITSDLDFGVLEEGDRSLATIKHLSEERWEKANNNNTIREKYGEMIFDYKENLQDELITMERRSKVFLDGEEAPVYKNPPEIRGREGLQLLSEEEYRGSFEELIRVFLNKSLKKDKNVNAWELTYNGIKDKVKNMEEELELYANDLSIRFKDTLTSRKLELEPFADNRIISRKDIGKKKDDSLRSKESCLEKLEGPRMNPSLQFQDQLNFMQALEKCNQEISFYISGLNKTIMGNFLLAIIMCAGTVFLHYILMQSYVLADKTKLIALFSYIAFCLVFSIVGISAPNYYFKKKIKSSLDSLKRSMVTYIRGYFEKINSFTTYINLLNQLDSLNSYLDQLNQAESKSVTYAKKFLWHKTKIKEHIRKCEYFDRLVNSADIYSGNERDLVATKIDLNKDVINNVIYWPVERS